MALAHDIGNFLSSNRPHTLQAFGNSSHFQGMRTVGFEHTAWDLALTTQSLSYLKPELAYATARLYTRQQGFQTMETSFMQSAFTPSTFANSANAGGLAMSTMTYLPLLRQILRSQCESCRRIVLGRRWTRSDADTSTCAGRCRDVGARV